MKKRWLLILLSICVLGIGSPVRAQAAIQLTEPTLGYTFGTQLTIEIGYQAQSPIRDFWVILTPAGDRPSITSAAISITPERASFTLDLAQNPLPAFSPVSYHFQGSLENGAEILSPDYSFFYEDNRFTWQSLNAGPFQVHWYTGDLAFGENILTAAQQGLQRVQQYLPLPDPQPVRLYAYASAADMQTTLLLSQQNNAWIAGHANPALGVIIISLPPGPDQNWEIKRQIPHELAHVLLYQWLGEPYFNLPLWLREGLASIAELFPNPDYQLLLDTAYANETLIPMASLCNSFPGDAANFLLSYAQSMAFTWYLHQEFGSAGLEALSRAYADGLGCEQGAEAVLGLSLAELERGWRRAMFGENAALVAWQGLFPWLILLGVVLFAPLGLFLAGLHKKQNGQREISKQAEARKHG